MYSILIVDDEPIVRRGIKAFADFEKYRIKHVYEAEDANSAFDIFSKFLPDLVLLDINIPFKDGLTLAEEMKLLKNNVKIAVISGYDYFEYAQKALKIGVEDYILKPVSKADINEIIANAIYIITKDCSNPYTTPPSLSHCFITGNLVIKFAKPLINNRIILLTINKPIATAILIIIIATFLAVDSTIAVFASFPAFSTDSFI